MGTLGIIIICLIVFVPIALVVLWFFQKGSTGG